MTVRTLIAFGSAMLPALGVALASGSSPAAFEGTQPQLAAAGMHVYLAFGSSDTVSVAASDDGGETFGVPSRVPISGRVALGMHRGPRIAATNSTVLVSVVAGAKGGGADGDVLLVRSMDSGRSWLPPVRVNDVAGSAREGLHAMAAGPSGLVAIAWLDLRTPGTRVYAAISRDHGATWSADVPVYASPEGSVCECCHPSIAIDEHGRLAIMFRNNVGGNRDMYVVQSDGGERFEPATRVGTSSWRLNACPMDGGGLTFAGDGLASSWRREDAVYLSTSLVAERRVGTGRDPAIAAAGGVLELAWSSASRIMFMRGREAPEALGPGRFPAILSLEDRTVLAWEDQGIVTVRPIMR
jgi:hypothetical protein